MIPDKQFPKIVAEWPNLQKDEKIISNPLFGNKELVLRVSTKFDGQIWQEQYTFAEESLKYLNYPGMNHKDIAFKNMEQHMKDTIQGEISGKVKKMVDQLLNVNPN